MTMPTTMVFARDSSKSENDMGLKIKLASKANSCDVSQAMATDAGAYRDQIMNIATLEAIETSRNESRTVEIEADDFDLDTAIGQVEMWCVT